jgi:hypothetical protein
MLLVSAANASWIGKYYEGIRSVNENLRSWILKAKTARKEPLFHDRACNQALPLSGYNSRTEIVLFGGSLRIWLGGDGEHEG